MKNENLCAITAITGQVGGSVARTLLDANQPILAVLRDADQGATWAKRGCEVAVADTPTRPTLRRFFPVGRKTRCRESDRRTKAAHLRANSFRRRR